MLPSNSMPDRIAVFIDAGNLSYMSKAMGIQIDFDKFRRYFMNSRKYKLQYLGYYTAVEEQYDGTRRLQGLIDHLSYNGYTVIEKKAKVYDNSETGRKVKGNMDIEITIGALGMAHKVDKIILVTGDGDFSALVRVIQANATPVCIIASKHSNMLSEELRKAASEVIDLVDIISDIRREPA